MHHLELIQIGNSLGVAFPKDIIERLGLSRGQLLSLSETASGIQLSPCDPKSAEQMRLADEIMGTYRETLRELAK